MPVSFLRRLLRPASAVLLALCCSVQPLSAAGPKKDGDSARAAGLAAAGDARAPAPSLASIVAERDRRLAEKGMTAGSPVMIRVFKQESELELWMQKGERFELFATYPICYWSGKLGPKLHEGDRQAPEGFYSVSEHQIHRRGRWPRSLNIGFPNVLDRANARTGSLILVHGGCSSIGCYAMTNPVMEEIYGLADLALRQGQERIDVHVFPFRMTKVNLDAHAGSAWHGFWLNLKEGYDLFERTRVPPKVSVCNKRYVMSEGSLNDPGQAEAVADAEVLAGCEPNEVDALTLAGEEKGGVRTHRAASKLRSHRFAGRNARKKYAAARRARMAAYSRQARVRHASASRRAH